MCVSAFLGGFCGGYIWNGFQHNGRTIRARRRGYRAVYIASSARSLY